MLWFLVSHCPEALKSNMALMTKIQVKLLSSRTLSVMFLNASIVVIFILKEVSIILNFKDDKLCNKALSWVQRNIYDNNAIKTCV